MCSKQPTFNLWIIIGVQHRHDNLVYEMWTAENFHTIYKSGTHSIHRYNMYTLVPIFLKCQSVNENVLHIWLHVSIHNVMRVLCNWLLGWMQSLYFILITLSQNVLSLFDYNLNKSICISRLLNIRTYILLSLETKTWTRTLIVPSIRHIYTTRTCTLSVSVS